MDWYLRGEVIRLRKSIGRNMPKSLKRAILLNWNKYLRWYEEQKADVILISYPKCGRTWLRLILGKALQLHFQLPENELINLWGLAALHPAIPKISVTHDDEPHYKSPETLQRDKKKYQDKKIILLVRDPRDALVSLYFHFKYRKKIYSGSMEEFLKGSEGGADTFVEFYNTWYQSRNIPRAFLIVRYESLHVTPHSEIRSIFDLLGIDISDRHIAEAIDYASFKNMREMERKKLTSNKKLLPTDPNDYKTYKTRSGRVNAYTEHLSPGEIEYLNTKLALLESFYGYSPEFSRE